MKAGLFLSRDDGVISRTVDVDALATQYGHLAVTRVCDSFFHAPDQRAILDAVTLAGLDAVVLAGPSEHTFRQGLGGTHLVDALERAGVNANRISFADVRGNAALAHRGDKARATAKAKSLIDVALSKVEHSHPVEMLQVAPRRAVLIAGTAAGGLIAAGEFVAKGYRVHIVEERTGLRAAPALLEALQPTLAILESSELVTFSFGSTVRDVAGSHGDYQIVIATPGGDRTVHVGGVVIAAGNDPESLRQLRQQFHFGAGRDGMPRSDGPIPGTTPDPGIWFLPAAEDADFGATVQGVSTGVLHLGTSLDVNEILHPMTVTDVDASVCGACGTCVKTCAFGASRIDLTSRVAVIEVERCRGCGNCVTACPTGARDLAAFPRAYVTDAIGIMARGVAGDASPKILAILCRNCGERAWQIGNSAESRANGGLPPNVMPLLLECGGSVDTQYVLYAFAQGFDGVAVFVCQDEHCHNVVGNTDLQRRLGLFRSVLRSRHIDDDRLRVVQVYCDDGQAVHDELKSLTEALTAASAQA